MKKIIYSLVIMIAAGSLFTSCVENTEPQGIRDLREAKADYLASLSKLREADAELVKAQAAYQSAQIAVVEADAALKQALANIAQAVADAAQLGVEYLDAELQMKLEADKAKAEQDAVAAQKILAERQAALENALRKIAAEAIGLTKDESDAITTKTTALNQAYTDYNTALAAKNDAAKTLWQVEYNVAAGKDNYETVESYKAKIADQEDIIAEAKAEIATLEALKETPSAVKDTIDALKAKQQDLKIEKQNAANEKSLYEASIFVEAKREYTKRWNKFVEDSIGTVEPFKFVDEEGENRVYEMNTVYNVQGNFVDHVVWAITLIPREHPGWFYGNPYVSVDTDGEVIEGKSSFTFTCTNKEGVEKALYGFEAEYEDVVEPEVLGLKGVVEALNRELVIVNNPEDSAIVAEKAKAAHIADSTYKADREILEIGFEKSKFAKKVTDSLAKLAADTVAEKAKYTDAAADLETKEADKEAKESEKIVAVRTAAAAFNAAVDAMATAVRDYDEEKDSAAFIKAIKAFGEAQAALNGYQDSLSYKSWDPYTGTQTTSKDAFSAVNPKFFVKGEEGHPVYNEEFLDVVMTVFGDGANFGTKKKVLIDGLAYNPLKDASDATDSIAVLKDKNLAVKAAVAASDAAVKVAKRAKDVADSLKTEFGNAITDYNTYKDNGTTEAKAEYAKIYNKFWGYSETHGLVDDDYEPYKFPWTDKTFEDPFACVTFLGDDILGGPTFDVVVRALSGNAWNYNVDPDKCDIFRNQGTLTLTEYANKLKTAQEYDIAKNYTEYKDQLANIEAAVNKAEEEFLAYCEEYEAATEGQEEILARLRGVDEDGKLLPEVRDLAYATIVDGKWTYSGKPLGGYQLAWAEELAPEYPKIVKDYNDTVAKVDQKLDDIANFITALETAYVAWAKLDDPDLAGAGNLANIIAYFDSLIKTEEGKITAAEKEIKILNEAVAKCEAGYSPAEVEVAYAKAILAEKERLLKQAEEALARAQKEYDEVIAKYGVNE